VVLQSRIGTFVVLQCKMGTCVVLQCKIGTCVVLQWLLDLIGVHEFLPRSELLSLIAGSLCNEQAITVDLCSNVLFLMAGFDSSQLNKVCITLKVT
jgi:hypothetical protein